jgi:hypothetical protein
MARATDTAAADIRKPTRIRALPQFSNLTRPDLPGTDQIYGPER